MTKLTTLNEHRCFGGVVSYHEHYSEVCDAPMRFGIFAPPAAGGGPVPALYFLAGLTSTEENFLVKGGAQRYAAEHGLMLVAPDTSPRRLGLPGEGFYDPVTGVISPEAGFYGAGFYVDATAEPYSAHYKMHTYVSRELPEIVESNFPARSDARSISGHSVGGHGALTIALKNPDLYGSVSAFAPICAPTQVPYGREALSAYLGPDEEAWREHDATELVRKQPFPDGRSILVDQGTKDQFLAGQGDQPWEERLSLDDFEEACAKAGQPLTLRWHEGYDHGYYFVSSFMEDHIRHHAKTLGV
jgi:S-formylglutathione hydrolase